MTSCTSIFFGGVVANSKLQSISIDIVQRDEEVHTSTTKEVLFSVSIVQSDIIGANYTLFLI
jgi:hypothetical protein